MIIRKDSSKVEKDYLKKRKGVNLVNNCNYCFF